MIPNLEQSSIFYTFCNKMCSEQKIRFCGVINSMGRLIAGNFKDGIQPLDNDQQRQMLYMQSKLELSMKSDFNDNLGNVNYVLTYRDNVVIINIPLKNQPYHVLISAERITDVKKIVDDAMKLFDENSTILNKIRHQNTNTILES
ncbi:hypothetical protein Nlim_1277 [Candidatus Nitrosarchaeum limnium SFB1]|jgi:hypothetical protein|uniref:Roadblock/LAMTOR2 domain-containing protein n=1 Tax=Candidatus Nitrosarchaeum limnium SFB1 TaxID=886738 RepID=F3KL98_9ARCH|nr:hypothetical protein Nlim_1277 [Candidatus Nitrosarchaeum limnium SFB1]